MGDTTETARCIMATGIVGWREGMRLHTTQGGGLPHVPAGSVVRLDEHDFFMEDLIAEGKVGCGDCECGDEHCSAAAAPLPVPDLNDGPTCRAIWEQIAKRCEWADITILHDAMSVHASGILCADGVVERIKESPEPTALLAACEWLKGVRDGE